MDFQKRQDRSIAGLIRVNLLKMDLTLCLIGGMRLAGIWLGCTAKSCAAFAPEMVVENVYLDGSGIL